MSLTLDLDCPGCELSRRVTDAQHLDDAGPCPRCSHQTPLHSDALAEDGTLRGCLLCGGPDLYRIKQFPRKVGLAFIAAAAISGPVFLDGWVAFLPLPILAMLDQLIHPLLPNVAVCYRCSSHHLGAPDTHQLKTYDLEFASSLERTIPWVRKR